MGSALGNRPEEAQDLYDPPFGVALGDVEAGHEQLAVAPDLPVVAVEIVMAVDAARTAARVGARRLAMTHMVPALEPEQYPEWISRAAEHFDGEIVIGDDLTTIAV